MGPVTEEEKAAFEKWCSAALGDPSLAGSLGSVREQERSAAYILVRARRAGAKLEDLL